MIKKTLLTLGLLTATTLAGCVVAVPRGPYVYADPGPVVVAPIVPIYGWYGGYYRGYGGYRGGWYGRGGRWR